MEIGVLIVNTIMKRHLENQIVGVFVTNDDERHISEYENYKKELEEKIPKETNQEKYWLENRLKSVKNRIRDVKRDIENGKT